MRTFINPRIGIFLNTDEVSSEIYKETYLVFQRPPLATLLVKSRSTFAEINSRKFLWKKFPRVRDYSILESCGSCLPTPFLVMNHFEKVMKSMNFPPSKMHINKNFLYTFERIPYDL